MAYAVVLMAAMRWETERLTEPGYHGKKLSEWTHLYAEAHLCRDGDEQEPVAALRAMGTNAVPWLIAKIGRDQPYWKFYFSQRWNKLPLWVQGNAVRPNMEPEVIRDAESGLKALGRRAPTAIPQLARIVADTHRRESRKRALNILFAFDENGIPVEPALPSLLAMEAKGGPLIPSRGVEALTLNSRHDYVPALAHCLHHRHRLVRLQAVRLLGRFRVEGRCGSRVFEMALADSDPQVRREGAYFVRKYRS